MPTTSRRRFPVWLAWASALVIGGLAVGAVVMLGGGGGKARPPSTATAQIGDIAITVSALGKIGPKTYVDVGAQVSGQLDVVHVQIGERVEQGQLLAEIDPRVYESRVEADRARVDSLQAQLAERDAALALARTTHERNTSIAARGLIAKDLVDTSGATLKQAQAQLGSIRAQLREAQSTLDGDVASLSYAKVYAPIAGTVVSQTVLEGQTLNTNQTAPTLLRIADLQTMTVTAQVAEADIPRIVVGTPAYFSTLGQPDRRWRGTVRQLLPTPDIVNEVVLYKVLIDVGNEDGALLPDMTAQVFFTVAEASDAVTVPVNAIATQAGVSHVQVIGEDGAPQRREVQVGLRDRDRAQILSGLAAGERVVVPDAAVAATQQGTRGGFGMFGPRR
ncbi:efflux RND transporter periplasmic adaptor subunit [Chiayiivirga flava]|uniref:Macrolide-specific efflux system membrane fusion protein n=1 Tax=Chiayiivirga flava TaxID=659595 RepID=A0A7W8G0L3_9GAMM|nr:efflux RND transporter periplasmic adaptor subunit [Chiayiivirga flava]MBB5209617.1 macrolide-specific efflux system membrane fusion protein [Chiayiivirga flava]